MSRGETYLALYCQARGSLKGELLAAARQRRTRQIGQAERRRIARRRSSIVPDVVMISAAPPDVGDGAVPGHWEADLLYGPGNQPAIVTLVERDTRFVMLARCGADHSFLGVTQTLSAHMERLPQLLAQQLAAEPPTPATRLAAFTIGSLLPVFVCDPHSSWRLGSNENTNRLLRQYFPKDEDLSQVDQSHLDDVACELNIRPRQTLGWLNPAEKLNQLLLVSGEAPAT